MVKGNKGKWVKEGNNYTLTFRMGIYIETSKNGK